MFGKLWENVKEHPWLYGGGVVVGLIIVYFIFRGGGSTTATDPYASQYATDVAAATALQQSQLQANAQDYAVSQAAGVQEANIAGQEALAQIQSNTQLGVAALQANVVNKQTDASISMANISADTTKYTSSLAAWLGNQQLASQNFTTQENTTLAAYLKSEETQLAAYQASTNASVTVNATNNASKIASQYLQVAEQIKA